MNLIRFNAGPPFFAAFQSGSIDVGFFCGAVLAIPVGLAIGHNATLYALVSPFLAMLRAMPASTCQHPTPRRGLSGRPANGWRALVLPHVERDFDLRSAFRDYVGFFDDWRRRSEAARAGLKPLLDVSYGARPRDRFDFSVHAAPDGRCWCLSTAAIGGPWTSRTSAS